MTTKIHINVHDLSLQVKFYKKGAVIPVEQYDLIEKAAEQTVEAILKKFPAIQAVEMELRKPDAPITCAPEDVAATQKKNLENFNLILAKG